MVKIVITSVIECFFVVVFLWSRSNLPSSSNNSTEFDDPTLIQNIENSHVGCPEACLNADQESQVLILCVL